MPNRNASLRDRVQVELVQSLFATTTPSIIMSVGFVASAWLICARVDDPFLFALAVAGAIASVVRLAFLLKVVSEARRADLSVVRARALERRFAACYFLFAAALGLFGARSLMSDEPVAHTLTVCLLVGYAAGVAAGAGLRPWIAIPSMVVAVVPAAITALLSGNPLQAMTGIMLLAFTAGGVYSLLDRYKAMAREFGQRITFAGLARQDGLTALPNRLALREWYDARDVAGGSGLVAVHYLDLNGFKPVNDRFGHPTGDELLRAVSTRLARILRSGDFAARLGGDEFVVVQSGLGQPDEADFLAQRLCKTIEAPFTINDRRISVSACVGYVTSTGGSDLEHLLTLADEALYAAKRGGASIKRFDGLLGAGPSSLIA